MSDLILQLPAMQLKCWGENRSVLGGLTQTGLNALAELRFPLVA